MAKIDRLGWADALLFTAYGVRVGVRVNDPDILDTLTEHFPPQWKPSHQPLVERLYSLKVGRPTNNSSRRGLRQFNLLYADVSRIARSADPADVLEAFEADLKLYVAEFARRRVFVHAGVVGWKGRAVLIPGASRSGKTTLVAELVRAGATYYSDDYAVLDARGRVHPYAQPLQIREEGGTGRQKKYAIESFGASATVGANPLSVALIVTCKYREGIKSWRPRVLTAGQGVLELLANTVSAQRRPKEALGALSQVVGAAPLMVKGTRGEASGVVDYILNHLENSRRDALA